MAVAVIASLPAARSSSFLASIGVAERDQLNRARLLDVVSALAGLNGATVVVAVPRGHQPLADFARLHAELNIEIVDAIDEPRDLATAIIKTLRQQRFERTLVLAGDALPIPPRLAATALSALEQAGIVIGPSRTDAWYAFGASSSTSHEAIAEFLNAKTMSTAHASRPPRLVVRHLERRTALSEIADLANLSLEMDRLEAPPRALLRWADHWL